MKTRVNDIVWSAIDFKVASARSYTGRVLHAVPSVGRGTTGTSLCAQFGQLKGDDGGKKRCVQCVAILERALR